MTDSSTSIATEVMSACRAGAAEAAEAMARALDLPAPPAIGEPAAVDLPTLAGDLSGPGLAVVFISGDRGGLLLIPEATGLLPPWYAAPDATGQSKLNTLAQELGMLIVPEQYAPDDFRAGYVKNLAGAMARGTPAGEVVAVPLELTLFGQKKLLPFIWPIQKPQAVLGAGENKPKPQPEKSASPSKPVVRSHSAGSASKVPASPESLPPYAKSLLRIRVPVVVTLARKRQDLARVMELGPGSIIQFDKSCEEMLELSVGDLQIAVGEAVKVGDKFGLRITSIVLPQERFQSVQPARLSAAS